RGRAVVARVGLGDDVGDPAVRSLVGGEVAQPLPVEAPDVVEVGGRLDEDLPVAGPPRPLPGGAVGGHVAGVAPEATVAHAGEPVDPLVGAREVAEAGQVGVDHDGGDVVDGQVVEGTLDPHVLEALRAVPRLEDVVGAPGGD